MRLVLVAATLAAALAGCASGPAGTPGTPAPTTPTSSTGPTASPHPAQLYANTHANAFAAGPGVVLRSAADVRTFVHWLRAQPRRGDGDNGVLAALSRPLPASDAVVVAAQDVGCDSIAHVSLAARGTDLVLVPSGVTRHPECFRANVVVAVFAVPRALAPSGVTINGQVPSQEWH